MDVKTHQITRHNPHPLLYVQTEINENQRDQTWMFYVNSICLKVKSGERRHIEENTAEGRGAEQRGMENRVLRER